MNGNFSTGTPTTVTANNPNGLNPTGQDTLPAGWDNNQATDSYVNVVASGSVINGVRSPSDPMGSAFYMAFQSSSKDNTQDCLYQFLDTVAGQSYTLSFWLAVTSASNYLQMSPEWDADTTNDQFVNLAGYNSGPNSDSPVTSGVGPRPFQQFFARLTASQASTLLFFHGLDSGGGAVLLADVSLTADQSIPEPLSPCLMGLGLMATFGLRVWIQRTP